MKDLNITSNEENREKMERFDYLKPSRYEQIAFDIAKKIADNQYQEGEKIYGRSTLAGQYNVSPETIRRAVAILQNMNIVKAVQGKGIIVISREAAEAFIKAFELRYAVQKLRNDLIVLLEQRKKIENQIAEVLSQLVACTNQITGRAPEVAEIKIEEGAYLNGRSLSSAAVRSTTGATVLGIIRNGEEFFSPDAAMVIQEGDVLIVIGSPESRTNIGKLAQRANNE